MSASSLGGFLAEEGAEVAVIDAGYAGGTTANAGSLHVQMQSVFLERFPHLVPRLESMLFLYKLAAAYWTEFQAELGVDCEVKVTGGLMIAEDQRQLDFLARKAKRETGARARCRDPRPRRARSDRALSRPGGDRGGVLRA